MSADANGSRNHFGTKENGNCSSVFLIQRPKLAFEISVSENWSIPRFWRILHAWLLPLHLVHKSNSRVKRNTSTVILILRLGQPIFIRKESFHSPQLITCLRISSFVLLIYSLVHVFFIFVNIFMYSFFEKSKFWLLFWWKWKESVNKVVVELMETGFYL